MKMFKLGCAMAAVLVLAPFSAFAQDAVEEEAGSSFAFSAALTNDYVWRGVTQSNESVAFQSGLTYTAPFGLYAGVWASNVEFPGAPDADFEVDGILGYNTDLTDDINFDVNLTRYAYPGAAALSWNELITKTTLFDHYSVTLAYSDDAWASGENGLYYALGTSWTLPQDIGLAASVGYSDFADESTCYDCGLRDYADYSLTLSKAFGPATLSVGYVGINKSGEKTAVFATGTDAAADDRVVVSISVAAP